MRGSSARVNTPDQSYDVLSDKIYPSPTSTRISMTFDDKTAIKTIIVLGGAYAGMHTLLVACITLTRNTYRFQGHPNPIGRDSEGLEDRSCG